MKIKGRRGSVAVFLIAILLSFVLITGTLAEAAAGYAARSTADGIFQLAGESVLGEFDRKLWTEYGLLGVNMDEVLLENRIHQYTEAGFSKSPGKGNLFRLKLVEVTPDLSESSLMAPELLGAQIDAYMSGRLLLEGVSQVQLDSFMGQVDELTAMIDRTNDFAENFQTAKALLEAASSSEDEDTEAAQENYNRAESHALSSVKDFQILAENFQGGEIAGILGSLSAVSPTSGQGSLSDPPDSLTDSDAAADTDTKRKAELNRVLANSEQTALLPSRQLDIEKGRAFSLSGSGSGGFLSGSQENLRTSVYILNCFDHHLSDTPQEDHFFLNEGEYILFGQLKDQGNYARMKTNLMTLRTALNLVHIYTDQVKYQETLAAASAILPGPGAFILQFIIALAWAGAEADCDIENLEAGEKAAFFKTPETWNLSLAGVRQEIDREQAARRGLDYEGYLLLFLLLTDRDVKLARIMDLIQLNLSGESDGSFRMENCHCRVVFTAAVSRESGFFGKKGERLGEFKISRGYD